MDGVVDENGIQIETFKVLSHSMGAAYSEGIISYLEEQGMRVEKVVHLSAADPSEFEASSYPKTLQLNLENDPVLLYKNLGENNRMSGADAFGEVNTERSQMDDYQNSHGDTKFDTKIFDMLEDLESIKFEPLDQYKLESGFLTPRVAGQFHQATGNENGTQFNEVHKNGATYTGSDETNEYIK